MTDDISKLPIFRMVPPHHLTQALDIALTPFEVGEGDVLLVEGENDDSLMVVVHGEVEVLVDGISIASAGPGELFGDMALFGRDPRRTATVRTLTPCSLVLLEQTGIAALRAHDNSLVQTLESQALRTIGKRLRDMNSAITEMARGTALAPAKSPADESLFGQLKGLFGGTPTKRPAPPNPWKVLQGSPAFAGMEPEELQAVAEVMELRELEEGELLIREGEHGRDAFVVAAGRMDVYRTTRAMAYEKVAELTPGTFFGLVSLVHGSVRSASCLATPNTWVMELPESAWKELSEVDSPASRGLRRALYDSLSDQLHNANHHVAWLKKALSSGTLGEREHAAFRGMLEQTL